MNIADYTNSNQYHHRSIEVRSFEVDFNQKLRITALFNYLQEVAWEHAKILNFGWGDLYSKGWFWALSRVEVEVERLPRWTDEVTLVTWPKQAEGIFALRDFEMYDSQGNRLIAATSSWLVVNISNRRPVRIAEWYTDFDFASRSALSRQASKVADCTGDTKFTEQVAVQVGDIDMNQHVNNVRYIDWAYNTLSIDHYCSFYPRRVVVNFNAEGKVGETLVVEQFKHSTNGHIVCINRENDSKNLCKLQFEWAEIKKNMQ